MKFYSILSVCLITLILLVVFLRKLLKKEIKPALAMWVMFSAAVVMSEITYLSSGDFGLLDNIMNTVDILYVGLVTIAIAIWGDRSSKINRFDLFCLIVVAFIVVFWIITQKHFIANILIQCILVIAYFPVVKRLLETRQNSESFIIWIGMMVAPALSLLSSKGALATVYSVRAIICISFLLIMMMWIEFSAKYKNA